MDFIHSIEINKTDAQDAVMKLSRLMRYLLYESEHGVTPLGHEINFMNHYIDLMRLRISPKVELKIDLPDNDNGLKIPPLLFIPFIENAFKHTDFQQQNSFIKIAIELNQKNFQIQVMNKISPKNSLKKETGGHGSESLEHRLRMIYENSFTLSKTIEQDIFVANLKINLHEFYTKMHSR